MYYCRLNGAMRRGYHVCIRHDLVIWQRTRSGAWYTASHFYFLHAVLDIQLPSAAGMHATL
jgi:hypothetical protein